MSQRVDPDIPEWDLIKNRTKIPGIQKNQILTYYFEGEKLIVEWFINLTQFKAIKKGNGGRAGIIPFFYDDHFQAHYFLNISNRSLLSDFGGGIKKKQTIYNGFVRELSEEIPKWKDELIRCLEDDKNYHKIHCVETIYIDEEEESKHGGFLKHQILAVCQVDPYRLLYANDKLIYDMGVAPSKEVQSLRTISHSDLLSFVMDPSNYHKINNGLHQFRRVMYYL